MQCIQKPWPTFRLTFNKVDKVDITYSLSALCSAHIHCLLSLTTCFFMFSFVAKVLSCADFMFVPFSFMFLFSLSLFLAFLPDCLSVSLLIC